MGVVALSRDPGGRVFSFHAWGAWPFFRDETGGVLISCIAVVLKPLWYTIRPSHPYKSGKDHGGVFTNESGGEGEGGDSFVACLSLLTIDHASISRWNTVPTPIRDTSNFGRSLRLFQVWEGVDGG